MPWAPISSIAAAPLLFAALVASASACRSNPPPADSSPGRAASSDPASASPDAPKSGEARLEGRYEVDPIPGYKGGQFAWLKMPDGKQHVLSYRPVPDHFPFVDKRVVVTGAFYQSEEQAIMASHFRVATIALAPGEVPYPERPTRLPAPPFAATEQELSRLDGRFAQVVGTLAAVKRHGEGPWADATLTLADGARVTTTTAQFFSVQPNLGKEVTITAWVRRLPGGAPASYELTGKLAVCPGKVDRCGMDKGEGSGDD